MVKKSVTFTVILRRSAIARRQITSVIKAAFIVEPDTQRRQTREVDAQCAATVVYVLTMEVLASGHQLLYRLSSISIYIGVNGERIIMFCTALSLDFHITDKWSD